jgi:hypothetical protein
MNLTKTNSLAVLLAALLVATLGAAGALAGESPRTPAGRFEGERVIDMRPHWDASIPLANPHKGWYHHFPDNHPGKYVIAKDTDLLKFPGMDHLYMK